MRAFLAGIALLFMLAGCGGETKQRPYVLGQSPKNPYMLHPAKSEKIETAKIESEAQKEIARINKERDVEVQKIASEEALAKAGINKEIAIKEVQTKQVAIEKAHSYSLYLLLLIAAALLLLILFLFYYTNKNRKERLQKHQDELMLKIRLQEQEMKMKMAEKMLDSITSGKLSPEQENRLIDTLEHTTTKLIEKKQ